MLHSVGCSQPRAQVFVDSWNDPSFGRACVHAFIDGDTGDVYQTLYWTQRGWHCGGAANNTHIGVEMCEPRELHYINGFTFTCSDLTKAKACAKRTYDSAVELFAFLCREYNLDPMKDGVVISHKEGHDRGIASDHGDPEHLWRGLGMPYTMDGFRKDVAALLEKNKTKAGKMTEDKSACPTETGTEHTKASKSSEVLEVRDTTGKKRFPYLTRVSIDDLYLRTGPGTGYADTGFIEPGVYTITEEAEGPGAKRWGRLKSGSGWIALDYTERVI